MKSVATPEGTRNYALRIQKTGVPPTGFRILGRTDLTISTLGFGGYRIDSESGEHIAALDKAIRNGCNLIDTSTNYTNGGSEKCVGLVAKSLFDQSFMTREELVVVSKVGYIQGTNLEYAQEREAQKNPYPDVIHYSEGCWHCIHPTFIVDQLAKTLERTGLKSIDVYLLHNPEYFFSDALHRRSTKGLAEQRQEFYRRIRLAFKQLETLVSEGKISHYGVSSNTFGQEETAPEMTSISEMLKIAQEISLEKFGSQDKHHFSVIQLPMNLFESGPTLIKNNRGKTALSFADENGLGVLINRPLNAFVNNQLVRLSDFTEKKPEFPTQELMKMVGVMEKEFLDVYVPLIHVDPESLQPEAFFRWSEELSRSDLTQLGLEQWGHIQNDLILPQVNYLILQLDKHFSAQENKRWTEWRTGYLTSLEQLLDAIRFDCGKKSQQTSDKVSEKLNTFLPENWRSETLSRKTLALLVHTKGVSCVLNGMRKKEYVEDSLGVMRIKPFQGENKIFETFQLSK